MKQVLSLLVIFVFLNVSSWAFAPNYPTSAQSVSGTYAGVLTPLIQTTTTSASIGVFAVGIPSSVDGSATANGAAVIFSSGAGYPSFINGVFDPQSSTLSAIIEGTATVSSTNTVNTGQNLLGQNVTGVTATQTVIFAQGNMIATLSAAAKAKNLSGGASSGPGTAGAERIVGTASLDFFSKTLANGTPSVTSTVQFTVNGFQQSSVYSVPTITIIVPTTGAGATGG